MITTSKEQPHNLGHEIKFNSLALYLPTMLTGLSHPPTSKTIKGCVKYVFHNIHSIQIFIVALQERDLMRISKLIKHIITLNYEFIITANYISIAI